MYLVANIDVEICASKSCKLCTQYCPEANTIQYSDCLLYTSPSPRDS